MESKSQPEWGAPSACPRLGDDDVHVWKAFLPREQPHVDRFEAVLSPDERTRSARFRREKDRAAFTLSRGILRSLLAIYCDIPPREIQFDYTEFGKPILVTERGARALDFNLSHSGQWALVAMAANRKVGVDVEHIRTDLAIADIASRFFSSEEAALVGDATEPQRRKTFFEIWVRKEAYLKAIGKGLSLSLDQFGVALESSGTVTCRARNAHWTYHGLDVAPEYTAALVAAGRPAAIHRYRCLAGAAWQG